MSQPAHSFGFGTVTVPAPGVRGYDLDDVNWLVAVVRSLKSSGCKGGKPAFGRTSCVGIKLVLAVS